MAPRRIILIRNSRGGCSPKVDPLFWNVDSRSIFDRNVEMFGAENVSFVGNMPWEVKNRHPGITVLDNPLQGIAGTAYALVLALKSDASPALVITSNALMDEGVVTALDSPDTMLLDENQENLGVCHLSSDSGRRILDNLHADYSESVSESVRGTGRLTTVSYPSETLQRANTPGEYLISYSRMTQTSFHDLREGNCEMLARFYTRQPASTRSYYKPHSFELPALAKMCEGPNVYLLAVRDDEVVGYGSLQGMDLPGPPSLGLIVDDRQRGSGCALALGAGLIQIAKDRDWEGVMANIDVRNTSSVFLCIKLGFDFTILRNARCYCLIDFKGKGIVLPPHYVEKTCSKAPLP